MIDWNAAGRPTIWFGQRLGLHLFPRGLDSLGLNGFWGFRELYGPHWVIGFGRLPEPT